MIAALASIGSAFTLVRVLAVVSVVGVAGGAYSGWKVRDWKADAEMNAAQVDWLQRQFEANTAAEKVNRELHDEHAADLLLAQPAPDRLGVQAHTRRDLGHRQHFFLHLLPAYQRAASLDKSYIVEYN